MMTTTARVRVTRVVTTSSSKAQKRRKALKATRTTTSLPSFTASWRPRVPPRARSARTDTKWPRGWQVTTWKTWKRVSSARRRTRSLRTAGSCRPKLKSTATRASRRRSSTARPSSRARDKCATSATAGKARCTAGSRRESSPASRAQERSPTSALVGEMRVECVLRLLVWGFSRAMRGPVAGLAFFWLVFSQFALLHGCGTGCGWVLSVAEFLRRGPFVASPIPML
mmetsp:Transcript_2086/g.4486  ORF Transcript_2086/g.4486 Transcript_2086/m.4486 type:complete len:227 (+) Transcript_2086:540-1220(+)